MVKDLAPSTVVPQLFRPANPQPVQSVATSEVLIALGIIGLVGLLLATGFVIGRRYQRSSARGRTKPKPPKRRTPRREIPPERRNLKLVTPKRR
jgi:cell division septation protein DedD